MRPGEVWRSGEASTERESGRYHIASLTNIAGLCYYHHRQIHDGHWQLTGDANKPLTMRAPDGREWHEQPKPQLAA